MLSGTFFGSANILKSYDLRIKIIMLFLRLTLVERFTCGQVNIDTRGGFQLSVSSEALTFCFSATSGLTD